MIRTVHIVEDDEAVRMSLHAMLATQRDVVVRSYASGQCFLDAAETVASGVLLLDHKMPGKTGLDVLAVLGAGRRFAPILLTGQGDIPLAVQAMRDGAVDVLEKPCEPQRLLGSIDDAFDALRERQAAGLAQATARRQVDRLSPRERAVFEGLIQGWPNKVIAQNLRLSPRTIEIHRANMMDKLGVRSLSEALRIAFTAGMIDHGAC